MQAIAGQYECVHSSSVGLDYFTSRIDRLTLHPNGRFILTIQKRSRVTHAAHSLVSGEQVTATAPETRLEGHYACQDSAVSLHFDNGGLEEAQLSSNSDGLQIGPNFFTKVSDSTFLPPTHRLKQDMEDIAKGIKIASTIGGMAAKAAKTIHKTIQPTQGSEAGQASPQGDTTVRSQGPPQSSPPARQDQPAQSPAFPSRPQPATAGPPSTSGITPQPSTGAALYCDRCGTQCRPGKRFCNNCGNPLI